jgi:hypothetical protein
MSAMTDKKREEDQISVRHEGYDGQKRGASHISFRHEEDNGQIKRECPLFLSVKKAVPTKGAASSYY